jgi:hypothetical protein
MSIHDLKQRMADVSGIETLTMIMIAGTHGSARGAAS